MTTLKWLSSPSSFCSKDVFPIPEGVAYLMKTRVDLNLIDIELASGRFAVYLWWEANGKGVFKGLQWFPSSFDFVKLRATGVRPEAIPDAILVQWYRLRESRVPIDLVCHMAGMDKLSEMLPAFLETIHRTRSDLQEMFDICTEVGRIGLARWWYGSGRNDYPLLSWVNFDLSCSDEVQEYAGFPIPAALITIAKFEGAPGTDSSGTVVDVFGLLDWWFNTGSGAYGFVKIELTSILSCMTELVGSNSLLPIPKFLLGIWEARADLRDAIDISKNRGRAVLYQWWFHDGHGCFGPLEFSQQDAVDALRRSGWLERFTISHDFPDCLLQWVEVREDLVQAFDLCTQEGRGRFAAWCNTNTAECWLLSNGYLAWQGERWEISVSHGVNVVGYPLCAMGLGEDARQMTLCLDEIGVDASPISAPMERPPSLVLDLEERLVSTPVHPVSVFCLPPTDMLRLFLEAPATFWKSTGYRIGAWPWELPRWPARYADLLGGVNEIWALSTYVQQSFASLGRCPVYRMPIAVEIPAPSDNLRAKFEIDQDTFYFYVLFDGASWLSRKNPAAAVRAFSLAFPRQTYGKRVGLVVKAMSIDTANPQWQEVVRMANADSRIKIINEVLDRQELINLMSSLDCYVSLHRSEGFGRVIAEAMLLEKAVVVTNFSGNIDFCNPKTAYLVDGPVIPVQDNDYILGAGQFWCDPEVEQAAVRMREVLEDDVKRQKIARSARDFIFSNYSRRVVSDALNARLSQIFSAL